MFWRSAKWRLQRIPASSASAMAKGWRVWRKPVRFFNAHRIFSTHRPVVAVKNVPKTSPTHRLKVSTIYHLSAHLLTLVNFSGGCLMMGDYFPSAINKKVKPDVCSTCTCHNETSVCLKKTCPVLECSPEHQLQGPKECCPSCPLLDTEYVSSTCTYKGLTYQVGYHDWRSLTAYC